MCAFCHDSNVLWLLSLLIGVPGHGWHAKYIADSMDDGKHHKRESLSMGKKTPVLPCRTGSYGPSGMSSGSHSTVDSYVWRRIWHLPRRWKTLWRLQYSREKVIEAPALLSLSGMLSGLINYSGNLKLSCITASVKQIGRNHRSVSCRGCALIKGVNRPCQAPWPCTLYLVVPASFLTN